MKKTESAISWMETKAKDDRHGYDQRYRWGEKGDYDCSAAVITAWEQAGVPVKTNGATYTGNMLSVFLKAGFKDVTKSINLSSGSGLKRGDVLLNIVHHTAMYCGNGLEVEASINEKGKATGGIPGDQTGKEFLIRSYRNYPWNYVLRYLEEEISSDPDGDIKTGGTLQSNKDNLGDISYQVHMRGIGWGNWQSDGSMVGSINQNRRIEAIKIKSENKMDISVHIRSDGDKKYNNITKDTIIGTTGKKKHIESIMIESTTPLRYRAHQKSIGWTDWKSNGDWAGFKGKSLQLEALQIYKPIFLVRGHIQGLGWSEYIGDKETVGTTGQTKRLEALQINPLGNIIEAMAHIQGTGWVDYGEITSKTVIGTTGKGNRLECLRLKGNFDYRAYIQGSGWTPWTSADGSATIGTTGQALRIEAIEFRRH